MDTLKTKIWALLLEVYPYDFCNGDYSDVVGSVNDKSFLLNWLTELTKIRDENNAL